MDVVILGSNCMACMVCVCVRTRARDVILLHVVVGRRLVIGLCCLWSNDFPCSCWSLGTIGISAHCRKYRFILPCITWLCIYFINVDSCVLRKKSAAAVFGVGSCLVSHWLRYQLSRSGVYSFWRCCFHMPTLLNVEKVVIYGHLYAEFACNQCLIGLQSGSSYNCSCK
jgi:hypothetical protein